MFHAPKLQQMPMAIVVWKVLCTSNLFPQDPSMEKTHGKRS